MLLADDSPLVRDESAWGQMKQQLASILDELVDRALVGASVVTPLALSAAIGRSRARSRAHPALSLRAASFIFQSSYPLLAELYHEWDVPDADRVAALALNRAVMDRMEVAVTTYVDYLLTKQHASSRDERRRVSRELHDVAGHELMLALQSLELHSVRSDSDPAEAERALRQVRHSLDRLAGVVREMASELRLNVGEIGLLSALAQYCATVPPPLQITLRIDPTAAALPPSYTEELFLLLREAARNAVAHAAATTLVVSVEITPDELTASVADDGIGYDPGTVNDKHFGLASMKERADLLGASLHVESAAGCGTRVEVTVRLPFAVLETAAVDGH